jgi:cullin 1
VQAEKRLKEESERVHAYLDKVSEEKLLKECDQQLLANHQTALLDKEETGCRALLREGKTDGRSSLAIACWLCMPGIHPPL